MQADAARPDEIGPAFELLLRHLPQSERDIRVGRVLELVRKGGMDVRGVFVLRDGGRLSGAIASELVAGAGAVVWPPAVEAYRPDLEDGLVRHACDWLRAAGARLAQCLLSPQDAPLAAPLLRGGFARATTLVYLRHDLASLPPPPNRLSFTAYDPARPGLFHHTLLRTYENTLDCPEVQGVRTVEEVIEGHRAQGVFDPARWGLALRGGQPVGVLVAAETAPGEEWDVGYMGVVPEARGWGVGGEMLAHALRAAREAGAPRVTLCVDLRNHPACRLYGRAGFVAYDERIVFLTVWRRAS
jgi:ribosomal protein S18 acetylase RimI-like enzyme